MNRVYGLLCFVSCLDALFVLQILVDKPAEPTFHKNIPYLLKIILSKCHISKGLGGESRPEHKVKVAEICLRQPCRTKVPPSLLPCHTVAHLCGVTNVLQGVGCSPNCGVTNVLQCVVCSPMWGN